VGRRVAVLVACLALALWPATPALAHDVGGVGATNFRTTLAGLTPSVPGVSLQVIENGSRLELRNDTSTEVVLLGYSGEPYARVGPAGVFVNDRSPATYLNADRFSITTVPATADPKQPPVWDRVDSQPVFRWHDHRIHWMLTVLPPVVSADPGAFHHISTWTIELRYGSRTLTATGALDWVAGPSPWPWFLAMGAIVAGLIAVPLRLRRPHRVLAAATVAMVVGQFVHGLGISQAIVGTVPQQIGAVLGYDAVLIWPLALLGAWLLWRGHARAIWLAGGAGVFIAVSLIVDDAPLWWRSSAPSGLEITLNRAVLAVAVGGGIGLAAAVLPMVRRHAPPSRPWTPAVAEPAVEPEPEVVEESTVDEEESLAPAGMARRQLAGYLAAGAVGAFAGGLVGATVFRPTGESTADATPLQVPLSDVGTRAIGFRGARQSGISVPARPQARAWVGAFDIDPDLSTLELSVLLGDWTRAAEALMAGQPRGDSDDAVVTGLGPCGLTITVGFGPSLFGKAGIPANARPAALTPLPAFPGEQLDPARSDGDLGMVIAADDALVVSHAARVLTRLTNGTATLRWQLSGFSMSRGAGPDEATGRNLMGQVDGSNNPKPNDPDFDARIFVPADDPAPWLRGGSYLVVRRIRMLLDDWDRIGRSTQEATIGRQRDTGAPLSGGSEFTPPDYGAKDSSGELTIAADAHIRHAAPAFNNGAAMLRRGFSYTDGDESGLLFLAWQADPRHGFIPVQRQVASDALQRFIRHETSALFAAPGGVGPDEYLGQRLLEP
jgi:deferrochelatase/peroxidase EfeB